MFVSVLWTYCMRRPGARRRGGGAIEFLFLGEPARSKRAARRDHEGGRRHHHHRLHHHQHRRHHHHHNHRCHNHLHLRHHHRNHRRHRRCLLFSTTGASPLCISRPTMQKNHIFKCQEYQFACLGAQWLSREEKAVLPKVSYSIFTIVKTSLVSLN